MNFGGLVSTAPAIKKGKGNDGLNINSLNGTVNFMAHGNNPLTSTTAMGQQAVSAI